MERTLICKFALIITSENRSVVQIYKIKEMDTAQLKSEKSLKMPYPKLTISLFN